MVMPDLIDQQRSPDNRLLAALPAEVYDQLVPSLEPVSLPLKQLLYEPNHAIAYVYFPLTAVISLVTLMQDGQKVEVGTIGNEGMVGLPVFWGAETISGQAFAQIPGEAMQMPSALFRSHALQQGPLQDLLLLYTQTLFTQMAQSLACNSLHRMEQRCARWLLMSQDRARAAQFPLTQEFLAQMLGVRRAGVSEVASRLQQEGLIQYHRGIITIVNREGLEAVSCECYATIKQEYDRLLGEEPSPGS
jgi:CRP-like cAMP-binding protein